MGLHTVTAVYNDDFEIVGWEIKCNIPWHKGPLKCRKNVKLITKDRSYEDTFCMVRHWLHRGLGYGSAALHRDDWPDVVLLCRQDALPECPGHTMDWPAAPEPPAAGL